MKHTASLVAVVLLALAGCQNAYYSTWEKLGWAKRDILVDRVEKARDAQEGAKEQFKTTLERFQELTGFSGGDLEAQYKRLNHEYGRCRDRAQAVTDRIDGVESVAKAMFSEWEKELAQYENAELRRASEARLRESRERYDALIATMRRSEASMKPVLAAFNDQVLFLKHNLNAAAISSLEGTAAQIDQDVQRLIQDMETAIAEADAFISELKKG